MTIRSMTGFGRASFEQNGFSFEILLKGINSRFAEYNFKLPQVLSPLEQQMRSVLQSSIRRGKVTLTVNGNFEILNRTKVYCDRSALTNYLSICRSLGLPTNGSSGQNAKWEALKIPGVLKVGGIDEISPKSRKVLDRMLKVCLNSFLAFKSREGRKIQKDLASYLSKIRELAGRMQSKAQGVKRESEKNIHELAARYCQNTEALRDRISFELGAALDRLDISEECSRLNFHISEFQSVLSSNGAAVGRKLDFLLQEMHREINTIGSKGRDPKLSKWVVEAKDYVERMREQVQNVE